MYIQKTHEAGEHVLVKNHTPIRLGIGRRKREKPTTEARKKQNDKKRAEKIQLLILANFARGYHVILEYGKEEHPETYEEAEEILTKFLYKMSRKYKRAGKKFKYLATTERGKRKAVLHHHMIVEALPGIIEDLTENWGDHIKFFKMYDDGQYKELAEYFVKAETKEELTIGKSRFHRSRNLTPPKIRTEIKSGTFPQEPRAPEGFHIIPETVKNGYNDRVGIRYQHYMLVKDPPKRQQDMVACPKVEKPPKGKTKRRKKCTLRESVQGIGKLIKKGLKRLRNG